MLASKSGDGWGQWTHAHLESLDMLFTGVKFFAVPGLVLLRGILDRFSKLCFEYLLLSREMLLQFSNLILKRLLDCCDLLCKISSNTSNIHTHLGKLLFPLAIFLFLFAAIRRAHLFPEKRAHRNNLSLNFLEKFFLYKIDTGLRYRINGHEVVKLHLKLLVCHGDQILEHLLMRRDFRR